MIPVGNTIREIFATLPDAAALRPRPRPTTAPATNLHVHLPPNFGSIPSVTAAIRHAQAEQIKVLGASNYYDHQIYTTFARAAKQAGIAPVFGIEVLTMDEELQQANVLVNDPKNPGKLYLCGKGLTAFDALDESVLPVWNQIRLGDRQRITAMLAKLNALASLQAHDIQLTYQALVNSVAAEKDVPADTVFLQERHVVQALQREIFNTVAVAERQDFLRQLCQEDCGGELENVVYVQNLLRNGLLKQGKAAYIDEQYISPAAAAQLILGLGGYVSYPVLADGVPTISAFEGPPDVLAEHLLERQIGAAEFIPLRNDLKTLTTYVTTLRQRGIVVAAGTEHNDAVWVPLRPACRKQTALTPELQAIFWEGACVAAAHQYLHAKRQTGYVFLPDSAARKARLAELATLGAGVIAAFQA